MVAFLFGDGVLHLEVHLLPEILRKIDILRNVSTQAHLFLITLHPQMLLRLLYAHPLLLPPQQVRNEIFEEWAIVQPNGVVEGEGALEDVGDSV